MDSLDPMFGATKQKIRTLTLQQEELLHKWEEEPYDKTKLPVMSIRRLFELGWLGSSRPTIAEGRLIYQQLISGE